jgi:hypothetical protein
VVAVLCAPHVLSLWSPVVPVTVLSVALVVECV